MSMQVPQGALRAQQYVAVNTFALPGNPALQVVSGTVFTFDGFTLSGENLPPRQLPQFAGAIKVGWVVLLDNYDPSHPIAPPVAAGMQLRPTKGGNPMEAQPRRPVVTAQEEERHVGSVNQHAAQVRQGNLTNYRTQQAPRQNYVTIEPQEGIPVRHLGNPGRQGQNFIDVSRDGHAAIQQAKSVQVVPGVGRSRDEVLAAMSPEQRAEYQAAIQTRKAMHGVLDDQVAVVAPMVIQGPSSQGEVVGRVISSSSDFSEGINSTQTYGGGTETVDLGGTGGQEEVRTVEIEGLTFRETNGPKGNRAVAPKPAIDLTEDPRRVLAKSICSDFPDIYNFEDSVRKKIARIQADFEDRPDIIRAVAAAEDLEMKTRMIEEFPEAFQS